MTATAGAVGSKRRRVAEEPVDVPAAVELPDEDPEGAADEDSYEDHSAPHKK